MTYLSDPTNLRIPGPTPLPPAVVEALGLPVIPHRGKQFAALFRELTGQLKRIHRTEADVFIAAGTGSSGWEASIVNCLNPGDTVLAAVNGNFGERFVAVAEAFGINVVRIDGEWGQPVLPGQVAAALDAHPAVKMVQIVYNETSTGVLNPIQAIGRLVRERGKLFVVDAVSGLAGARLEMDTWCCDIVFSGSQKALMCPPGLAIFGVGDRVWEAAERATIPRFTLDFRRMRKAATVGSTPATAPVNMIYALKAACDMIEAEGLDNVLARHQRLAAFTRAGFARIGLELYPEEAYASPTVAVARVPEGVSAGDVVDLMRQRHGIEIAAGQGKNYDEVIRIGTMGWTGEPELQRTIEALDDVLEQLPA
jgi:aspartate aminotransferase-like enzyme